jgi:putative MATE family efflux protein
MTDEALGYGLTFFHYLLPGLAVMVPLHVLFGILQGQGLTKLIATAAVLSTVINVALDPVFIFTLKMGVAGAGCATSIAVTCAAVFVVTMFARGKSAVPLSFRLSKAKPELMKEIVRIGFPNFLSMASMSVSFMVFNKLVSAIGQDSMNAFTLAGRMDQAVLIPSFAVGGATSIMISQNYGRNQLDRVRAIYRRNVLLAVTIVAIAALLYMSVAPHFFAAFSDVAPVIAAASRQVRLLALTFVGIAVAIVTASTFQATGRPMPALVLSLVRMGVVSLPIAFVLDLVLHAGMNSIYVALGTGNLIAMPLALWWARRHLAALRFRSVTAAAPNVAATAEDRAG